MLNIKSRAGLNKQNTLIALLQSWATGEKGEQDMLVIHRIATAYQNKPNGDGILPCEDKVLCNLEGLVTRYMGRKIGLTIESNRNNRR